MRPPAVLLALIFAVLLPLSAVARDVADPPAPPPPLDVEKVLAPLSRDAVFRTASFAAEIVDVQTGERVYGREPDKAMVPASTMKVLTAAAALRTLGPAYRFSTDIYADAPIDAAGVLQGNLYIQGHGDPSLVVERLWKLLHDLKLTGLQQVRGDVIFDGTYFDQQPTMPGWDKTADQREGPAYFATSSALSVNFNTVTFVIGPGAEVGLPARVQLDTPASTYVTFESQVTTGPPGSRGRLTFEREAAPPGLTFKLEGSIPSDAEVFRKARSVLDPTAHFIAVWRELEAIHEIKVTGKHKLGTVPATATLIHQLRSPPLTAVLMDMNKYSNNFIAEQVLKAVAAEVTGLPGAVQGGLDYLRAYLTELGVNEADARLVNGSGLSRDARLTPAAINRVMVDMARNPKLAHEFYATLALAGWDGTMWSRLTDDPGRVRGKTGTIDGVHCLTGFVDASDGRRYAFTFLVNDLRAGSGPARRLHDRMLRALFHVPVE